jgi:hypothetical protein
VAEIAAILQRAINDAGPRADDLVELATALASRAGQAQGEANILSLTTREVVELDEALREALDFIEGA